MFEYKLNFLCRDYHSRAKFSNVHASIWTSESDYVRSGPKTVISCRQLRCIILFIFYFFTVYRILLDPIPSVDGTGQHNSIALLIVVDGDVSLGSSVYDYGQFIVINVL